jgi:cysteine desulfurase
VTAEPIYLDHNATTPVAAEVVDAMLPYLTTHFGNPSSSHSFGRRAAAAVALAREQVAALLGAGPDEIVFTSGGTESNNLAIRGTAAAAPADRRGVVSSCVEHPATTAPLGHLRSRGWSVTTRPVDATGAVIADGPSIPDGVALVTVMLAQNETGAIMPIAELAEQANRVGAIMHTDAAQALGKIDVNVDALGVDLLSLAGHKAYAPKGVGALYVRRGTTIGPVLLGAGQEYGIRPGTENVAGIVALGAACEVAGQLLPTEAERQGRLRDRLWHLLDEAIPGMRRHTPENSLPNTLMVSFPGVLGRDVLALAPEIAASTGSACHSGVDTPAATLLAMGVSEDQALAAVRLSLGRATTEQDLRRAVAVLTDAYLRSSSEYP